MSKLSLNNLLGTVETAVQDVFTEVRPDPIDPETSSDRLAKIGAAVSLLGHSVGIDATAPVETVLTRAEDVINDALIRDAGVQLATETEAFLASQAPQPTPEVTTNPLFMKSTDHQPTHHENAAMESHALAAIERIHNEVQGQQGTPS